MDANELKTVAVDKTVDARGTACPGPLLAAKKEIANIASGEVMEVLSEEDGYFRIYLKKG